LEIGAFSIKKPVACFLQCLSDAYFRFSSEPLMSIAILIKTQLCWHLPSELIFEVPERKATEDLDAVP